MLDRKEKLSRLIQLGIEVSQISDLDVLLEKVLGEARLLVNADAGSIYIKEGDTLKFSYAQNDTLQAKLGPGKKLIYTTFSMPIDSNLFEKGEKKDALTASTWRNTIHMAAKAVFFGILLIFINVFHVSFVTATIALVTLAFLVYIFDAKPRLVRKN